jgi:hypothetical protein
MKTMKIILGLLLLLLLRVLDAHAFSHLSLTGLLLIGGKDSK